MWPGQRGPGSAPKAPEQDAQDDRTSRGWFGRRRADGQRPVERELHRLLREELRDLGIHPPLDIEELCRALGKRRGRPLFLRAAPLETPGASGLWMEYEDVDVILYQQETTRLHQEHIVLHEVGHILLAEREEEEVPAKATPVETDDVDGGFVDGWAQALPVFSTSALKRVSQRCAYEDGNECAVELAATIVLEWASVLSETAPLPEDPSLRRVQSALGDRRGWL